MKWRIDLDEGEEEEREDDESEDQLMGEVFELTNEAYDRGHESKWIDWEKGEWRSINSGRWDEEVKRMEKELKRYGREVQLHITEVYSPPRVTSIAGKRRLIPGFAMDLTSNNPLDGRPWDFNCQGKRDWAKQLIKEKRALLLLGSPMCAAFS